MERGEDAAQKRELERVVSRETFARLTLIVELLERWQKTINLVAPATLPDVWRRHVVDSIQLLDLVPSTVRSWLDLGSGGGFPGLVVAAVLAEREGSAVHLVESDTRKAAFLRESARVARLPVTVHAARIEAVAPVLAGNCEVVSARALAPLPKLLDLSAPFFEKGVLGVFPKGKDARRELTEAAKGWTLQVELVPSRSDPEGQILVVRSAKRVSEIAGTVVPAAHHPPDGA